MARNGDLLALAREQKAALPHIKSLKNPSKVVHIGHSYGSFVTAGLLAANGSLSDGTVLTGYIPSNKTTQNLATFNFEFAKESDPTCFSDRPSGYIVPANRAAIHTVFFAGLPSDSIGGFSEEMLDYGEAIKQPGTVGEFTSVPLLNFGFGPTFRGPLQYMEPEYDYGICDGDCKGAYDMATLKQRHPNAAAIEVFIQPNTGHGMTFHRNATAGYQATFDFIAAHGL